VIDGIRVEVDPEAVIVTASAPLDAVSSAVVGGGHAVVDAIVNAHVPKGFRCADTSAVLAQLAQRRGIRGRYAGMLTAAATERAEIANARHGDVAALAIVTVGLSNRVTAGLSPPAELAAGTINMIVVVDADADVAALVNAAMTATEVKTLTLVEAGVKAAAGSYATGTSTDAVVVAATRRGPRAQFGGPVSELGWVVASATGTALRRGVSRWIAEHAS
jgi:iron complex transport system ATP-binding protein